MTVNRPATKFPYQQIMLKKPGVFVSRTFAKDFFSFKLTRQRHEWIPPKGYDTGIKVYNRVVGDKVPLVISNKNYLKCYICGPTVYDVSHVGHASCYVRFDIINRILKQFFNINPVIALGITDIDDKIIISAYKKKVDFKTLAREYEFEFFKELNELNVLKPSFVLRVSEHLPEIFEFISKIIEKGGAYVVEDGSVYFNKSSSKTDWKLVKPPEKESVPLQEGQKNTDDFALWKGAKPGEPFWESPWGKGRPGWHIECSAMASKIFGSQLDIHGGGVDLMFPHHENEETQSCSYHDCSQWVNYWLHVGQLQVEEMKMSKSFKNFVPISDFLKSNTPDHLRMFCFVSNYNSGLHYSPEAIKFAVTGCEIINRFIADAHAYVKGSWMRGNISEADILQELEETDRKLREHLRNDFNTSQCYIALMDLIRNSTRMLNEETPVTGSRSPGAIAAVAKYVTDTFQTFGFQLDAARIGSESTQDDHKLEFVINQTVNFRSQVRTGALTLTDKSLKSALLTACDSLRKDLSTVGIEVKDLGKTNSSWSYKGAESGKTKEAASSS